MRRCSKGNGLLESKCFEVTVCLCILMLGKSSSTVLAGHRQREPERPRIAMKSLSRTIAAGLMAGVALAASLAPAGAAEKVTFLTSWFAQAEHGGFYQAKAT